MFIGAMYVGFKGKKNRHLRARRCDQLLLSGDQIFTPARQPGPQDR